MLLTESYQQLSPWLCAPLNRQSRAYLETHPTLLDDKFAHFLALFVGEESESPYEQHLCTLYTIWRDARARGGTKQAVREAYIDALGGMVLDIPAWLWKIEQQYYAYLANGWTDRTVTVCKMQLHSALERAIHENLGEPEVIAELQYQLGSCFLSSLCHLSVATRHIAAEYYRASLHIYTAVRYPKQYKKVLLGLEQALPTCSLVL